MIVGIGESSQWGKIKANLVTESVNTPLQDKLEDMASLVRPSIYLHALLPHLTGYSIEIRRLDILVQPLLWAPLLQWWLPSGCVITENMC